MSLQSQCLECGAALYGAWRGQPLRFCAKEAGQNESTCAKRYRNRKDRIENRERYRGYGKQAWRSVKADPERLKRWTARHRVNARRYFRKLHARNPSIGRERFNMVDKAVPRHFTRDTRMEIIEEACLFYAEGQFLKDAVVLAIRKVNKGNELQNYKSKDIDDCFWLADESNQGEMHDVW